MLYRRRMNAAGGIPHLGENLGFVGPAILLLLVPGPTNTLLATRGALLGLRPGLSGVLAEIAGYGLAILLLRLLLEPITAHVPAADILLRGVCASYLAYLSYRLWTGARKGDRHGISLRRIFVTTLTNPKALLFAVVILPTPTTDVARTNVINGLTLLTLIMLVGTVWTMAGALALAHAPVKSAPTIGRISSLVLTAFSLYIFVGAAEAGIALYGTFVHA